MYKLSVVGLFICIVTLTHGSTDGQDFSLGLQILGKAVRNYLNSQVDDVKLGEGVHLINNKSPNDARANNDDGTVIGAFENYLRNHEIRIRLPELMPEHGIGRALKDVVNGLDSNDIGKLVFEFFIRSKSNGWTLVVDIFDQPWSLTFR